MQAPQSHRQQVPTRWKYDLEVTFTHCICQHHTSQPLNSEFEFGVCFTTLTCMNSLGSYIYTFGRYKKVNPKNGLGELLELLILTTLHFGKDLSLLHSAKCSVSTQLTYIQKIIQFNKGAISTIKVLQSNIFKMH